MQDILTTISEICQNTVTESLLILPRIWSPEKCKNNVLRVVPWRDFYILNLLCNRYISPEYISIYLIDIIR